MKDQAKNPRLPLALTFIIFMMSFLLGLALMPTTVGADLPPRPTPAPAEEISASSSSSSESDHMIGAYIELNSSTNISGLWTIVQWKGNDGYWHDVEGWQGTLLRGKKIWWVDPADFGKGPFRWAVYEGAGGDLLGVSATFNLPTSGYQYLPVGVALTQD